MSTKHMQCLIYPEPIEYTKAPANWAQKSSRKDKKTKDKRTKTKRQKKTQRQVYRKTKIQNDNKTKNKKKTKIKYYEGWLFQSIDKIPLSLF